MSRHFDRPPSAPGSPPQRRPNIAGRQPVKPAPGEDHGSPEERELFEAIRAYQASSGRMFPTWTEVLKVAESLGYRKRVHPG